MGPGEVPPHPRSSAGRSQGLFAVLGLLAVLAPVAFHHAYLTGDAIFYWGDSTQLQFPRYVTLAQALSQGDFPLWQTLVYGGSPFHANPENPTLYPPTLLLAWLTSAVWTINATVVLHLAFAALGMFLVVRRLGSRMPLADGPLAAGALVAAVAFTFSHFMRRDHVNLVAYGAAHAWIPWTLLAADGLLNGERPARSAGWLAACVALIFFTGGLYVIPYACLALALWMVALGVFGDARQRRRTLVFGGLAAVAALLLVCAKLLPYREWLPTTNRTGRLSLEDALGTTLLTRNDQPTDTLLNRVYSLCGGPWIFAPALFALGLWRQRVVRVCAAIALLGFAIALGGSVWRLLYEYVPPFDHIRSAVRAWTIVNAFFPPLLGLGVAWLLSRSAAMRARPLGAAFFGLLLAGGVVLLQTTADPRDQDGFLTRTDPLQEVLERTPNWIEAAARAQDQWRVGWPELDSPAAHNEQFVASALGAETMVGYQGHVWPTRQEAFVYGPEGARVERETRLRRLAAMSVRWLVVGMPVAERIGYHLSVVPLGLQGDEVVENRGARARLSMPAAVVGVIDDDAGNTARALLDQPAFPIADAAIVSLPWSRDPDGERASAAEIAACDLVLVWSPLNAAEEYAPVRDLLRRPGDLRVLGVHLSEEQRAAKYAELADEVAERAARRRRVDFPFERAGPDVSLLHVAQVDPGPDARGRWVVATEPWSWYPGWRVEGLDGEPTLRVVEGISSAFLLPPDAKRSPLVARYAPESVRQGALLAAVGALLVLALVLAPQRGA